MFEINNGTSKIDGQKGIYDNQNITNPSVKYGRNAVSNYYSYIEKPIIDTLSSQPAPILDFNISPEAQDKNAEKLENFVKENDNYLKSLPPLEYEYRYMPNIHKRGEVDTSALMGAAYEELGARKQVSVNEVNNTISSSKDYTADALDLNKDGSIDIGEYGTTLLAADMLSKSETPDISNIDGTINQDGHKRVYEYAKKSNAEAAAKLYSNIYNQYNLGSAAINFNPEV